MRTPKHRLLDHDPAGGDLYEKRFWPLLREAFPNYEVFWGNVIWDFTQREQLSGTELERLQLVSWLPREIQILCQCHYTVFRSLSYIGVTKDLARYAQQVPEDLYIVLENERMKNIYAHFGVIQDMANRITSLLVSIGEALAGKPPKPKTLDELQKDLAVWYDKRYEKAFDRFVKFHRPASFQVHGRGQDLSQIAPDMVKRYIDLFDERLSRYRNLLHNANMGRVISEGQFWVPKPEFIEELSLWSDMMTAFSKNPEKFESLDSAFQADFLQALGFLNDLWEVFLTKMEEFQAHAGYKAWFEAKKPASKAKIITLPPGVSIKHVTSTSSDTFGYYASGEGRTVLPPSGQLTDPHEK